MTKRTIWTIWTIGIILAFVLGHITNVYNGTNKGITVGSCGYEIIGIPGFFCNSDN